jgi:ribonuclease HI
MLVAEDGVYTDGSCVLRGGENQLGAAYHQPISGTTKGVQPMGRGPTNTVLRAELSAINRALHHFDDAPLLHVYTDSLSALAQIHHTVMGGPNTAHYLNRHLLMSIMDALTKRADQGMHTHIHKVKAHTGACPGNDAADRRAGAVARGEIPPDEHETSHTASHDHHAWVGTVTRDPRTQRVHIDFAANLHDGLESMIPMSNMLSGTFANGVFATGWLGALSTAHNLSNYCWQHRDVHSGMLRMLINLRWGGFWNMKLARMFRSKYHGQTATDSFCRFARA